MERYLSMSEVAALLGVHTDTVKKYVAQNRLPEPDAQIGRVRGWKRTTIEHWNAARPGQGARTDL